MLLTRWTTSSSPGDDFGNDDGDVNGDNDDDDDDDGGEWNWVRKAAGG